MLSGTIAVCTRNRIGELRQCLASLETQYAGDHHFDVLVVDNASTDETAEFLRDWERPGRHAITEPRLGLSQARNAALQTSTADVVAFLDDDALAPATWMRNHLDAHEREDGVVAVGGPVVLAWPDGRPTWATTSVEHWWSALDLGTHRLRFQDGHGPYGTNMSVDRRAALAAGAFPTALGRKGRSLLSSEEAVLATSLERAGGALFYEPSAVVIHQVLPERLSRRWILRRGFAQGRSNARRAVLTDTLRAGDLLRAARAEATNALRCGRELVDARPDPRSGAAVNAAGTLAGHVAAACSYSTLAAAGPRARRP